MSLDVFRGLTIAAMVLVNNQPDPKYWPLEHAEWHGWTPTDLIFPFFLFIVGITTHLSLQARRARGDDEGALVRQIVRRGLLIFLAGVWAGIQNTLAGGGSFVTLPALIYRQMGSYLRM